MRYFLAALALCFATPAAAQEGTCAPAQKLAEFLAGPKYGEAPFLTLAGPTGPIKLFVNLGTGTWTIVGFPASQPGVACVIAGGKGITPEALPIKKGTSL